MTFFNNYQQLTTINYLIVCFAFQQPKERAHQRLGITLDLLTLLLGARDLHPTTAFPSTMSQHQVIIQMKSNSILYSLYFIRAIMIEFCHSVPFLFSDDVQLRRNLIDVVLSVPSVSGCKSSFIYNNIYIIWQRLYRIQ